MQEFGKLCSTLHIEAEGFDRQVNKMREKVKVIFRKPCNDTPHELIIYLCQNSYEAMTLQPSTRLYEKELFTDYFNSPEALQQKIEA